MDLADAHDWTPDTIINMTIGELLFWHSRNLTGNPIGRYTGWGE